MTIIGILNSQDIWAALTDLAENRIQVLYIPDTLNIGENPLHPLTVDCSTIPGIAGKFYSLAHQEIAPTKEPDFRPMQALESVLINPNQSVITLLALGTINPNPTQDDLA